MNYINYKMLLFILVLGFISCEKEEIENEEEIVVGDTINYPTSVSFIYNGKSVMYGVIKKDYHKNSDGIPLNKPISKLWLDRNLGAEQKAINTSDPLAFGDLFQWGRKADGHQLRTSETTQNLSETVNPDHDKFIAIPLNSNDWLLNSNDSLWNDTDNTNCSCPEGWRVPTIEELSLEMHSWSDYNMEGAFNSSLKWVSGGSRDNNGIELYSGYWAFIWSSTFKENGKAMRLSIIGSDTCEVITGNRIYGSSIRCIKDLVD